MRRTAATLVTLLALAGCSGDPGGTRTREVPGILTITSELWVGWDVNDVIETETVTADAVPGATIDVLGLGDREPFTITDVTDIEVTFTTTQTMVHGGEYVNEITVRGVPVEFRTASDDAEVAYTVTYAPAGS